MKISLESGNMNQNMKCLSRFLSTSKCHFSLSISPPHSVPSVSEAAINLKFQYAALKFH